MGPIVSIIIPVYNRQMMIDELIDTLPDRKDLEVIIVDDGSDIMTRCSRELLYLSVKIVCNDIDKMYAGTARNKGLSLANGEWVMFMDSDDKINSHEFKLLIEYIYKSVDDVILFKSESFAHKGVVKSKRHEATNWIVDQINRTGCSKFLAHYAPPWGKIIRRKFIKENDIRFDDDRVSNDVMFSARLAVSKPKISVFCGKVYRIRDGHDRLTKSWNPKEIVERIDVVAKNE